MHGNGILVNFSSILSMTTALCTFSDQYGRRGLVSVVNLLQCDWLVMTGQQPMGQHDHELQEGRHCGVERVDSGGRELVQTILECELHTHKKHMLTPHIPTM